jgi:hypothetical protein
MPVDLTYKVINIHHNSVVSELFIMTGISELEHKKLKNSFDLHIVRGNCEFDVTPDDVLCYGDIDFHEGSDDCKELDTFNWLEDLSAKGVGIPSRYNYDKHECTSPINKYLITETFRNSTLCRYIHGCLGKPQYTLIFREIK